MKVRIIADNIISPLGFTTEQNLRNVYEGRSGIARFENLWRLPENIVSASLFTLQQWESIQQEGLTRFESLAYCSIKEALSRTSQDVLNARTLLLLSTTKANVDRIDQPDYSDYMPAEAAQRIAHRLGLNFPPIVVCNACISGVSAQVTAMRLVSTGLYDYVIVSGCDVQSQFIVSGFQSLKAVSPEPCRPFDMERLGLNLGEAAATLIFAAGEPHASEWQLQEGVITNDAMHITTPCPKGTGSAMAMEAVLEGVEREQLAFVSLHGTATMYNDQMEAMAMQRVGLSEVPASALKGYYGHTMGAAGVLETILSLHAMNNQKVPASIGFEVSGVSAPVRLYHQNTQVCGTKVLKVISGFGGCNGAVLYSSEAVDVNSDESSYRVCHTVRITPDSVVLDNEVIPVGAQDMQLLNALYRNHVGDYPKFFKMDLLSRLGFLAAELLLQKEVDTSDSDSTDRAVILFNHSSSVVADRAFQHSISGDDGCFPSPSVFVYTLPNIVAGEIAIRNGYHGETSFYILGGKDQQHMEEVIRATFTSCHITSMLAGWVNAESEDVFEADMSLIKKCNKVGTINSLRKKDC